MQLGRVSKSFPETLDIHARSCEYHFWLGKKYPPYGRIQTQKLDLTAGPGAFELIALLDRRLVRRTAWFVVDRVAAHLGP
ncbi:MAG: hypothetical protein JWR35_2818 [Marmoricola sp.]|nr:hypothetical protein [Marmoricola sp.]